MDESWARCGRVLGTIWTRLGCNVDASWAGGELMDSSSSRRNEDALFLHQIESAHVHVSTCVHMRMHVKRVCAVCMKCVCEADVTTLMSIDIVCNVVGFPA